MNRKHQCHGVLGHCPLSVRPHESGDPVFPSMRLTPGSPLARGRTEDRTDNEYSSVVPAERRRREAGEHLCWKSSMFWRLRLPHSILADQGVCEDDEFSGDGDESDLGRLSAGCETLIEGLQVGVEARRRECGQIQDTPDAGTTAPNDAHAVAEAGLIG